MTIGLVMKLLKTVKNSKCIHSSLTFLKAFLTLGHIGVFAWPMLSTGPYVWHPCYRQKKCQDNLVSKNWYFIFKYQLSAVNLFFFALQALEEESTSHLKIVSGISRVSPARSALFRLLVLGFSLMATESYAVTATPAFRAFIS